MSIEIYTFHQKKTKTQLVYKNIENNNTAWDRYLV